MACVVTDVSLRVTFAFINFSENCSSYKHLIHKETHLVKIDFFYQTLFFFPVWRKLKKLIAIIYHQGLVFIGTCIVIYFYGKTNLMHQCLKFILFWNDTLHVSDGLSAHRQEFKTVHTATKQILLSAC